MYRRIIAVVDSRPTSTSPSTCNFRNSLRPLVSLQYNIPKLPKRCRTLSVLSKASTPDEKSSKDRKRGTSSNPLELRRIFTEIGRDMGFKDDDLSAWYKVNYRDLPKDSETLASLPARQKHSLPSLLKKAFPEHYWDISKFQSKPRNYWDIRDNQLRLLSEIAEKVGIKNGDLEGWYKVTATMFAQLGGGGFLNRFNKSMASMLRAVFHEHAWDLNKFTKMPQRYWANTENQLKFMEELRSKLNISEADYEAWYKVTIEDIIEHGGRSVLDKHGNSVIGVLRAVYPSFPWDPSKFAKKPQHHWASKDIQRQFVIDLGIKLGIKEGEFEKWYKVSSEDFAKNGGSGLLGLHRSSVSTVLKQVFPGHPWDISKFAKKPKNYWDSLKNQKTFFEGFGRKIGIKEGDYEKWYKVTTQDFVANGGAGVLDHYNFSLSTALKSVYPEFKWDINRFPSKPRGYWTTLENQFEFIEKVRSKLGIGSYDYHTWYGATPEQVLEMGGSGLLFRHNNSLSSALRAVYPDHTWDDSQFNYRPRNHWSSLENQRAFMDQVRIALGIKDGDFEAWYKVGTKEIAKQGGRGLLELFISVPNLLQNIYPEHDWQLWKFAHSKSQSKGSPEVFMSAVQFAESKLGMKDKSEWYRVSKDHLKDLGLKSLLDKVGGLPEILRRVYPDHKWDDALFL